MNFSKLNLWFWLFVTFITNAQDIIPKPTHLVKNNQHFKLTSATKIYFTDEAKAHAELLESALSPATGWDFNVVHTDGKQVNDGILLHLNTNADLESEGYTLNVFENNIEIVGKTKAGIFYGIQSLLQLLPVEIYNPKRQKNIAWEVQGVEIKDAPLYAWRGMMLDVSRYFFGKEYVLKFIDMMSLYKLNILHLHLIDDAGWRLEIKKYPKLTSVGAWRGEGINRTGGYYTQEDIKEIVAHAALRNIDVVPEIELPAHTLAAISAYPHLSCRNENLAVQTQHFISRDLYCVGKESTFEFLEDVFNEVFELFPSKYIHIGGDEAKYDRWKACVHCQKRKQDLDLESEVDLQVYFTNRIQVYVKKRGKIIVGWDQIIERGLKDKAVGMIWYNKQKTFNATSEGHDVVMALTDHCYFDVAESNIPGEVKAATWLPPISLEQTYRLNPMIEGLDAKYRQQVLGGHACLWSDQFIHGTILQEMGILNENRSEKYFDYLTFPRMAALAEVIWTPLEKQNWDDFENRMQRHYNRFDQAGYGYRVPQPKLISKKEENGKHIITLKNVVAGADIRYSINGVPANAYSEIYSGDPIQVDNLLDFEAITVVNRSQYSLPLFFPKDYSSYKAHGTLLKEWKPSSFKTDELNVLELNATGKINKNKEYQVSFFHLDGTENIEIVALEVYKNGNKITEDTNAETLGESTKTAAYKFNISDYETGASFVIKVKTKSNFNTKSYGAVFIK